MFNLMHPWHLLIVAAVIVLCVLPKKLPELAKGLGETLREFRKTRREIEGQE